MRNILLQYFLSRGLYISKMRSLNNIKSLVRRLRPIKTNIDLVRIGSENDGGYLVPDDMQDVSMCFSPGVDVNASFEIDLLKKFNINSHLADFSVNAPPLDFKPLSFVKKYVGSYNSHEFIS